ncbi:MAG: hypothetical protein KDI51_09305 [Xanthomonadales bacterium]|nr:hypothetical protein [Xanthomonadales bacterium]
MRSKFVLVGATVLQLLSGALTASECDDITAGPSSCATDSAILAPQISFITSTSTPLVGNSNLMMIPPLASIAGNVRGGCPAIQACGGPTLFGANGKGYREITMLPQSGTRNGELSLVLNKGVFETSGADYATFFQVNFQGRVDGTYPYGTDGGIAVAVHSDAGGQMVLTAYGVDGDTGYPAPVVNQSISVEGDARVRMGVKGYRASSNTGGHLTYHFYMIVDDLGDGTGNEEVLVWVNAIPSTALNGAANNVAHTELLYGNQMAPMNFRYGNLGTAWKSGVGTSLRPVFQFEELTVSHW